MPGRWTSPDTVTSKERVPIRLTVRSRYRKRGLASSVMRVCASSTVRPATGTAPIGGTAMLPSALTIAT